MKKYALSLIVAVFLLSPVTALATPPDAVQLRKDIKNQIKQEVRETLGVTRPADLKKEIKEQAKEQRKNLLEQIKDKLKAFKFSAKITGTLKEKSTDGKTLVVTTDTGDITVNITDKTQLRRRFWGKSNLSEFSVGDKLNIIGSWHDDTKTVIDAVLIRNTSIQRRWGIFFGDILSKTTNSFVIKSAKRADQTVMFDSDTKFVSRDEKTMSYDDITLGHRVRIKGVWDSKLNQIVEVDQVKDFSYPAKPSTTPTVTPTGTITPTATPTNTPTPTPSSTL